MSTIRVVRDKYIKRTINSQSQTENLINRIELTKKGMGEYH